ncbi:Uncharacterised protein [Vibrio cholerae]|nr:Uncharacterised protein [Vibrio cholerae]
MIHQVGGFANQLLLIPCRRRQRDFNPFFTHFLRNAFGATRIQRGRVRRTGIGIFALCQQLFQLMKPNHL